MGERPRRFISFFTKCQTSEWIQEQASGGVRALFVTKL